MLEEFVGLVHDQQLISQLTGEHISKLLNMVSINVLRPLGNCNPLLLIGEDCPDIPLPQWPHLSLVYVILLKLLEHRPDCFTIEFADGIIYLLNSASESERMQVKFFIGGFCVQFPAWQDRIMIRLIRMLVDHREGIIPPFGVASILEILLELFQRRRQEVAVQNVIFKDHLLPLISNRYFSFFVRKFNCILESFHAADPVNGALFIDSVSLCWPRTHLSKQIHLLTIVASIIPHLSRRDFVSRLSTLFRLYSELSCSASSKIAEVALSLWDSLEIQALVTIYGQKVFPLVVPSLIIAAKEHWCGTVQLAANRALTFVSRVDHRAIPDATFRIMSIDRISPWTIVATEAARRDSLIKLPVVLEEIRKLRCLGSPGERPERAASVPRLPQYSEMSPHICQPKVK
jgi:hypothetical protein